MSRLFPTLCTALAWGAMVPAGWAAEPTVAQEVHELRRDVQLQTKKVEALSEQILRLTQLIEERNAVRTTPEPVAVPAAKPAAEPAPEIPKAEAVPPLVQHVVAKGETLTSIAKQFNIAIGDLQKLNKITNERKLQIGQTLNIPASATKTPEKPPEAPAEKKENP